VSDHASLLNTLTEKNMNRRLLTVFAFALLVSAAASAGLYRLISTRITASAKAPASQMIVASRQLDPGSMVKDSDIRLIDAPTTMPKGTLVNKQDVVGRGVIATIFEGEAFNDTRLALKGGGAGFAASIPQGMRAVAVHVNEVVGASGFVVPGMRVDVLITGNPPGESSQGTRVKTLLQNIEVLSAGQNFQRDAEGKPVSVPVVNLLVNPDQAEVLSLAGNETKIQLILRNPLDQKMTETKGTAVSELFGRHAPEVRVRVAAPPKPPAAVAQAPPPPPPAVVEIISGTKRVQSSFAGEKQR
jgi:pilus assembly protein CpaB